jgi:hypothetical protein
MRSKIRKGNAAASNLISKHHRHKKLEVSNQQAKVVTWSRDPDPEQLGQTPASLVGG